MRGPKSERSEGRELVPGRRELGICVEGRNSLSQRRPRLSVSRGRIRQSSCAKNARSFVANWNPGVPKPCEKLAYHGTGDGVRPLVRQKGVLLAVASRTKSLTHSTTPLNHYAP